MDYKKMPVNDIVKCLMERNSDPITRELVLALADRVPHDPAACAEEDRRSRSIVISGLSEADMNLPPTQRQRDLDHKVDNLLDALGVDCHPVQVYRMGKPDPSRPRMTVKLLSRHDNSSVS
ncbi:hypothetical protein ANCDUO_14064 [Ancylostoma duodenale]|uniref:Uncharacterized protein n=1 Tax=Ancylostoma duodenale TaxID=51022 RepID=A0A0C2CHC3_9BILA|nr:hypothetical protein ANCDUO_14064 [Ancylostoma duodenale]